jgi:DnaJ-class molecular chaperone
MTDATSSTGDAVTCPRCNGKGWYRPLVNPPACDLCHGTGQASVDRAQRNEMPAAQEPQ